MKREATHRSPVMQADPSATKAGYNLWTVPWTTPEGPGIAAVRAGTHEPPEFPVSQRDIEAYQTDGVLLLEGAFAEWVEPLRRGLERNLADPGAYRFPAESTYAGEPGRFFDSYCNWPLIPEYWDFALNSPAASLAGRIMRSQRAQFFHEHAFVKEPGTQRATPWHQDMPYYCVSGTQSVSIYIALDTTEADVSVRYVRGSHLWDRLYRPKVWLDGAEFEVDDPGMRSVPDFFTAGGEVELVSWPLEPGDAVLFNFRTVHGTGDAPVRRRRRAFSTRWLGDDARYVERAETSPPFVDMGTAPGERMREDWFPVVWRRRAGR